MSSQNNEVQQEEFIRFLKNGLLSLQLIPGTFRYEQVLALLNIVGDFPQPPPGVQHPWFQDAYFWFDENGILINIELLLKPLKAHRHLPKLLNASWFPYARRLSPNDLEKLVTQAQIPCLKALRSGTEDISPPFYILDHMALTLDFTRTDIPRLEKIYVGLARYFVGFEYQVIWPPIDTNTIKF